MESSGGGELEEGSPWRGWSEEACADCRVTSPAWGQAGAAPPPQEQEAAPLSHQAAGGTFRAQRPRVGCHAKERSPEPLQAASPTRRSHSCSAEGSWEVGGRREQRQGQQPQVSSKVQPLYLQTLSRMEKLRLWERQGLFSFSTSRGEILPPSFSALKSPMAPQHPQNKPTHLPVFPKALFSSCNFT